MRKRTLLHRTIRCVIACAFFGLASCGDGSMNGIYNMFGERPFVFASPSGSGDYSGSDWANTATLFVAISNARDGQEIWMKAGSYSVATIPAGRKISLYGGFAGNEESRSDRDFSANPTTLLLNVDNGITIEGLDGIGIQMTIEAGSPVIMKNCNFVHDAPGMGSTMIACNGNGTVTFSNCRFVNRANTSSLVSCINGAVNFFDCKFEGIGANIAGGINCANSSVRKISVSRCDFTGLKYHAIYVADGARCDIEFSTIRNCTSYSGIYSAGICNITGSTIRDCSSTQPGGGISNVATGSCTITDCLIDTCTTDSGGGAISTSGPSCIISNTIIRNCVTNGADGGGIFADGNGGGGKCTINATTIELCKSTVNAGGGISFGADCSIADSIIRNCSSKTLGGGICGASSGSMTLTISGSTITGNTAASISSGPQLYLFLTVTNGNATNSTIGTTVFGSTPNTLGSYY